MDSSSDLVPHLLMFPLFSSLEKHPLAQYGLAALMKRETYPPRGVIIDEHQNDGRMFFLLAGQVQISKADGSGQIVVLGRVDASTNPCFGESVLLGSFARSATVSAYSQCECLSLDAEDFEKFMEKFPYVAASIYREMARVQFERLRKADKDLFIAGLAK